MQCLCESPTQLPCTTEVFQREVVTSTAEFRECYVLSISVSTTGNDPYKTPVNHSCITQCRPCDLPLHTTH
ncbi:hypothetical protein Y032_0003g1153 [Ancylostoma ceylanicum]|uniref:Uncharacterized protein n=1 Tax=Ancylostoma ceylanicum TaxID=53326 RepID=A0A016VWD6_9BILA|nr:hypothetical protein Y032_0003g1153 [Ancylostoma ceylanicum]